jgi:hypothetical protein
MAVSDRRNREKNLMSKLKTALATSAVIVLSVVGGGLVMALPAQAATTAIAHITGVEDGTNDGETNDDGVEDGTNDGETADDQGVEDGTNDGETNDDQGVEDGTNDGETNDDAGN